MAKETLLPVQDQQTDDDEDLEYPIPYSEEKAQQWAREDPDFDIETYRQDSYFTKANQADLRRAIADVRAGNVVECIQVDGEWVEVDA